MVGQNTLSKVIKTMLHDARIDGYFTGHSLRRSGTSRLFQAGVDCKLIKEISGHKSDAVDCYAITSKEQRCGLSKIIAEKPNQEAPGIPSCSQVETCGKNSDQSKEESHDIVQSKEVSLKGVECNGSEKIKVQDLSTLINQIVEKSDKSGKTRIKIEIEITLD